MASNETGPEEKPERDEDDRPHKSTGNFMAKLAGRLLENGGRATRGEVMAMAASLLSQYEK
jgi:hypothetical protein